MASCVASPSTAIRRPDKRINEGIGSKVALDKFAQADGFKSWAEMRDWFLDTHEADVFVGFLIKWGALQ